MTAQVWTFEPFDSWFFRESRPHNLVGGVELSSVFPPPARTTAGAVRTLIGEKARVDWRAYGNGDGKAHALTGIDLIAEMGNAHGLGRLRLSGPYLERNGQRLYAAPAFLAEAGDGFCLLRPGDKPTLTDLGNVYLPAGGPTVPRGAGRPRPLKDAWLEGEDLRRLLAGDLPAKRIPSCELWEDEPRLGIGRDIEQRTAAESLLYQTRHIRPHKNVRVSVEVAGIAEELQPGAGTIRFGGEGRPARVETRPTGPRLDPPPTAPPDARGIVLIALTPADLSQDWKPPGFGVAEDEHGATVWRGEIEGVPLTLTSAALQKSFREGGWNLAENKPRAARGLVPAGSSWFCRIEDGGATELDDAVRTLHGARIGRDTELGRGELAAGYWR